MQRKHIARAYEMIRLFYIVNGEGEETANSEKNKYSHRALWLFFPSLESFNFRWVLAMRDEAKATSPLSQLIFAFRSLLIDDN